MRVVIDTNVFVSSFFGGKPREIINLWKDGKITLCLSKDILDEYVNVLQIMGLENQVELMELLALFKKGYNILFSAKTPPLKIVESDPGDDKFIECAVVLKAEYIISGDKALQSLREYMGIRIRSPHQFLKILDGIS